MLLTTKTLPAGKTPFTQEFDEEGRAVRQTDSRGNATAIDYDTPAQGTTQITDALSNASRHRHRGIAQLSQYFDADGASAFVSYDTADRWSFTRDRLGDTIRASYHQPSGRVARFTDATGAVTTYSYAEQAQGPFLFYNLTRVEFSAGSFFNATHDARGNVLMVEDQDSKTRVYSYNARGQRITETNPAGGVTRFDYHDDGTLAVLNDQARLPVTPE